MHIVLKKTKNTENIVEKSTIEIKETPGVTNNLWRLASTF